MSRNEPALIERAQRGDRAAFRELIEAHYGQIYRVAYRYLGSAAEAEDRAQDVCVKLAGKLASFRGDSLFSTWLHQLTLNACRDYIKQQGSRRGVETTYSELEELQRPGPDSGRAAWLHRTLATFDPVLKETALLVLSEELSHAEAAKVLACAESTVSWRLHEVRKLLKNLMEQGHE